MPGGGLGDLPLQLGGPDTGVTADPFLVPRDMALGDDGDLDLSSGDLYFRTGTEAVRQAARLALGFYAGEWFLDSNAGLPYHEVDATGVIAPTPILTKSPNVPVIRAIMRARLEQVQDVRDVISFDCEFDPGTRIMDVSFHLDTVYGDVLE